MKNKKIILAAVAFIAVVAIFLTVYFVTKPQGEKGEKEITVTIVYPDSTKKVLNITSDREFLADALIDEGLFTKEDIASGMTYWVDGVYADSTPGVDQWWAVYADGKMPDYGMKEIPLKNGSSYELVFTVGYAMFS